MSPVVVNHEDKKVISLSCFGCLMLLTAMVVASAALVALFVAIVRWLT